MTYWIGGSPCAGKSSIAALLAVRHGLPLFECDARLTRPDPGDTWERLSRPPGWQAGQEVASYHARFPLLLGAVPDGALAEGADLLPELLAGAGVPPSRAVWVVPTPDFQRSHYAARPWVRPYLAGCPDPEPAFANWMERDVLFARHVRERAAAIGGAVIEVDGSRTVEQTARLVERHLGLVLS